jgi:hypothetical protein
MKIDKVIFGVDDNPLYADFWPIQAKLVKEILKAEPVLFHITIEDSDFYFDGHGTVKKINKDNCFDIITSFQSQIVRMYGTKYFPDEICLTADIDMLMLNPDYFIDQIKDVPDEDLIIFDSMGYDPDRIECQDPSLHCHERYPICYNAGKGKTFDKILNTNREFSDYIDELQKLRLGWGTDEIYFARCVDGKNHGVNVTKMKRGKISPWITDRRIERHNFPVILKHCGEIEAQKRDGVYNSDKLKLGFYIDAHCPRPYNEYKNEIDELVEIIKNVKNNIMFNLGIKHNTDKITHHRYDRIYSKFLDQIRNNKIKLFEIGCGHEHASFDMWQEYFPLGEIYCMDINEELETDRGKVYKGDQTNKDDLCRMAKIIGNCDVIIDDGSHIPQHQIDTFNYLFENMLNNGGIYIIEDIECTYWNPKNIMYGYEVGNNSIVDHFQSLPHRINSEFSNLKNHQLISSVTYFKNCIIFIKMSDEEIIENFNEYRFKEML